MAEDLGFAVILRICFRGSENPVVNTGAAILPNHLYLSRAWRVNPLCQSFQ